MPCAKKRACAENRRFAARLRERRGYTHAEIGQMAGASEAEAASWETGAAMPTFTQLSTDIVQSAAEDGGLGSLLAELHFCERAPAEAEHGLYQLHAPANFPQDARMLPLVADARANCLDLSALSLQECLQSPAVGAVCAAKERVCLLIDRTDTSQKTLYWK